VTRVNVSYFNLGRGGLRLAAAPGALDPHGYGYDHSGLVRVMAGGAPWPDILILGEAERYAYWGQEGARLAVRAMRQAGGPGYEPLFCTLPRGWGDHFAPVIFVNPVTVEVRLWHSHHAPDWAERDANLLVAAVPGREDGDVFRVVTGHGDLHDGDTRLADAKRLRRLADPSVPCLAAMDWNSVPSGPMWQDQDLDDPRSWPPGNYWARAHRIVWRHGPAQAGPHIADTRALDYLIGWWDPGQGCRAGGIGFCDVAELAGDFTPTQVPVPDGRQRRAIDRFLVNEPMKDRVIRGLFKVHEPADPARPDSDHKRVDVAADL
jgi:hypothetical protein